MTIIIFIIYVMLNFGAYSNFVWLLKCVDLCDDCISDLHLC